ncbi:hypothetical protein A8V01_13215 [Novosphingobium guangzhouense]|uniref:Uncharacterized protein n=1 Tax=Novosphingobium guangzhouense TaxID=1850347 RepID=A0A2K2G4S7_9SPHN|nr:hypothetical protein A8V01_13215 [Novosphingobium guangzhouense]
MSRSPSDNRVKTPGISRWPARQPITPGVSIAARPAPFPPCGGGRAVGVALDTDDGQAVLPSSPSVVAATLTVFEGQAVFRAERPLTDGGVLLFRLRRGSRRLAPGEIQP